MQALMLAAGMGKRLGKYTRDNTKCMLEVDGKTLIERAIEALLDAGVQRMVIVDGYKGENLKKFLMEECKNPRVREMELSFIDNDFYNETNNIYSLYLAKDELMKADTILLESDLIYDYEMIRRVVESEETNVVAVAKYEEWMDGTVVKIDSEKNIMEFIEKKNFDYTEVDGYYKTVNIYKLSRAFSERVFLPFLEAYIEAYGKSEYYELVLKIVAHLSRSSLKALDVSDLDWYEIDDAQDLDIVKCKFASGAEKLKRFQGRYGGYWRFEDVLDYCYLVNPYFPPKKMMDKMKQSAEVLIAQYPSGQKTQCINASRLFNAVEEDYLCVGNGAAELIEALGRELVAGVSAMGNGDASKKKALRMYTSRSVFNEYMRCFGECEISTYDLMGNDLKLELKGLLEAVPVNDVICLVNPDNPTGAFLGLNDVLTLLDKCLEAGKMVIFDESFIDFADSEERYTLLDNEILEKYSNLIVIKSISKSYGVPGIRLGVMASGNRELMAKIREKVAIWNINSFGEYFLQIINLFKKEYDEACDRIAEERSRFIDELGRIRGVTAYPSQANFVFCKLEGMDSTELAIRLLEQGIFIKDLKTKEAFRGLNCIRLAVRGEEDNDRLLEALRGVAGGAGAGAVCAH